MFQIICFILSAIAFSNTILIWVLGPIFFNGDIVVFIAAFFLFVAGAFSKISIKINNHICDKLPLDLKKSTQNEARISESLRDCIYYFLLKNEDLQVKDMFLLLKETEKIPEEASFENIPLFTCRNWEEELGKSKKSFSDVFILNENHFPVIQFFIDTFHKKHRGKITEKNLITFCSLTERTLYYKSKMDDIFKSYKAS